MLCMSEDFVLRFRHVKHFIEALLTKVEINVCCDDGASRVPCGAGDHDYREHGHGSASFPQSKGVSSALFFTNGQWPTKFV